MKRGLAAAAVMLLSIGCGRSTTPSGGDQPTTPLVNGAEFFQLLPGKRWVLRDTQHPEQVTTITAEVVDGALRLVFISTTHENDRILYLDDSGQFFYMGNRNGSEAVGDQFPDDIRLKDGVPAMMLWFQGHAGFPCPVLPSGSFTVPAAHTSPHQYFVRYADGREEWSDPGFWVARWALIAEDVLRIRIEENFGSSFWYFDWVLRRGHGFVELAWWNDAARTSLIRRISEAG